MSNRNSVSIALFLAITKFRIIDFANKNPRFPVVTVKEFVTTEL